MSEDFTRRGIRVSANEMSHFTRYRFATPILSDSDIYAKKNK
jgi:hypothetical protein